MKMKCYTKSFRISYKERVILAAEENPTHGDEYTPNAVVELLPHRWDNIICQDHGVRSVGDEVLQEDISQLLHRMCHQW